MRFAFIYGVGHHLLALASNFLELRADRFEHAERVFIPGNMQHNSSFCEVPVRLPKSSTEIMALVSPEDYPRVVAISNTWHLSSSGYVVSSKRENGSFVATYMHRLIAGTPARHANGDRLDNRRSNLLPIKRQPRRVTTMSTDEIILHMPIGFQDWKETCPREQNEYQTIDYGKGKLYAGEIMNGLPHGLGTLIERNRSSFGWFLNGDFKSGIVCDHFSSCERLQYLYAQRQIRPIRKAFLVRNNGKHELVGPLRVASA